MASESENRLTVLAPGLQTLLQDEGRTGLAFYAIPSSGPLDPHSADLANALLCNPPSAPILECHFVPPRLRFESPASICLAGAHMQWTIDGRPVKRQAVLNIEAGGVLAGSPASEACRGYIAIAGEIQTERTFGSAACYPLAAFGGNQGKPLAAGDIVCWQPPSEPIAPLQFAQKSNEPAENMLELMVGPEFDWLTPKSRTKLLAEPFAITPDSNRMGARLAGPKLSTGDRALNDSVPLLPGMVQLPPSGHCIVVLQDGQTTGGYPRIGYIAPNELARFNQIPLGREFGFAIA